MKKKTLGLDPIPNDVNISGYSSASSLAGSDRSLVAEEIASFLLDQQYFRFLIAQP